MVSRLFSDSLKYASDNEGSESFDWFKTGKELLEIESFRSQLKQTDGILILGCGNSSIMALYFALYLFVPGMGEDLWEAGFTDITNVDYADNVIEMMRAKTLSACPSLKWMVADVRCMTEVPPASFDVVIDKGTMDALLVYFFDK